MLDHQNILPLLGIVTTFAFPISIVSAWMDKGNAYDFVQDPAVDPRPLVILPSIFIALNVTNICSRSMELRKDCNIYTPMNRVAQSSMEI